MKTETVIFDTIIPHDVPVNIAELLTNIEAVIRRHVILSNHTAAALAVWVLHTYTFEMRDTVAYVAIESPEKRCGKTTLLSVLAAMACKPLIASNITVGALFRSVHTCSPTLFIDEADTFMAGNGTMRGIINSGNTRRTAYVLRLSAGRKGSAMEKRQDGCAGAQPYHVAGGATDGSAPPDHRDVTGSLPRAATSTESTDTGLKKYSCWCPKVIAMIGEVPDTIADRSIVVNMTRKLTTETCAPLSELDTAEIKSKCARFALDMGHFIGESAKIRCDGLNDRAADTFDPLFVIARLAGEDWETKLRAAALTLSATANAENSGTGLIMDIIDIFVDTGREKIFTRDLVPLLRDGGLKSQVLQPFNITEYQISKILRRYGIKPISVRIGKDVKNGYHAIDFREAVRRYVSYADREANLKAAHQRWQLQREAAEEAAKQQALFEKFKAVIPIDEALSDSELKELALKIKREQEMVETIAGHAEQPASQY